MNGDRIALYDFAACRAIDKSAQESGIAERQLMGQAALASLYTLKAEFICRKKLLILCGPGNNGGDGLALAYMLLGQSILLSSDSFKPKVKIFALRQQFKTDAARFYAELLKELAIPIQPAADFFKEPVSGEHILVEALLGTGQSAPLRQEVLSLLQHIAQLRSCSSDRQKIPFLLSLDIPAGLSERGAARFYPPGSSLRAALSHTAHLDRERGLQRKHEQKHEQEQGQRHEQEQGQKHEQEQGQKHEQEQGQTYEQEQEKKREQEDGQRERRPTLAAPDQIHSYGVDKVALHFDPFLAAFSKIFILPMGFHPGHINQANKRAYRWIGSRGNASGGQFNWTPNKRELQQIFLKEPHHHKYSAGHGLLIGGSQGMEGAVIMAARAFFAAGGGILHVLVPDRASRQFLTATLPSVMFHDPDSFPDKLSPETVLIGPGLQESDLKRLKPLLKRQLEAERGLSFLLLDAGGLPLLPELQLETNRFALLPHRGEWRALGGPLLEDLAGLTAAVEFHRRQIRGYLLLKDSISILFMPPEETAGPLFFCHPLPALATAGSGDSLAGILLAIFSRRNLQMKRSEKILAAVSLLHASLEGYTHPNAENFAHLIEQYLQRDNCLKKLSKETDES